MPTCSACGQDNPDVARFCLACGAALEAAAPERRKLATLLFCDVTGSTALGERTDAETVRELMFRYFHEMRAAIERHGGTVEKFVGDAVMAAFGIPEAHEDDALRACRAALEMQERVAALGPELERRFGTRLQARIGVNTGEVVAGAGRDTFATGDAFNVAARLEQAARPGEVLLGEPTLALVRDAVDVESVAPVRAKGKAEPVPAFRLRNVATRMSLPAGAAAFVGRDHQLRLLLAAFEACSRERRAQLVTVVGEPGVGKSRLVAELERAVAARVLRGRCLSYGEGITFWPLAEIVREAASVRDEDSAEAARAKLAALAEPDVASRIAALVGFGGTVAPEEVAWAVRRFIRALASERPLVLLVEDVHWAEPTLLDLIEGLDGIDARVLVLATARPELLDQRQQWPGVLRLEPLRSHETTDLLAHLLDRAPDPGLVERAGGNPLFVHELAALLRQGGDAAALPASLSALLAARLDRLPAPERDAVERASVEGELFHRGAVAALLETDVYTAGERVAALVEREFAFPAEARLVDEAAFRFRHVLVRDAAYGGLVKRLRAQLHERLADWLDENAGERLAEVEEIVGYHLEQAHAYAAELGLEAGTIGERAAGHLFAAGRRAADRGDVAAAANLVGRAVDLTPADAECRVERLLHLPRLLFMVFGDLERAEAALDEAERLATEQGDERLTAFARLDRWYIPDSDPEQLLAAGRAALPLFEREGDELGLAKAWMAISDYHYSREELRASHEAMERSLDHARRAGDAEQAGVSWGRLTGGLRFGPYHVDEGVARLETGLADTAMPPHARPVWMAFLGALKARRGEVEAARDLCRSAEALAAEFGNVISAHWVCDCAFEVESLAGDLDAAEALARENLERTQRIGRGWPDVWFARLASTLIDQERLDEAWAQLDHVDTSNRYSTVMASIPRARLLARAGKHKQADREARAFLEHWGSTDFEPERAEAYRTLAEVLTLNGNTAEARDALERALEIAERLGWTVAAEQTRALIGELGGG